MTLSLPGRVLLCALLGAGLLAGCSARRERRATSVPVVVATAERRTIPYEIEATGTVEAVQSAEVTSQVGGLVTRVFFREGDEVRTGQALFQIDPRPLEAAAARAAAQLARSRAQALAAKLELERGLTLAREQLIAESDLDTRRAQAEALAASVRADEAALLTARLDLRNATVRAPIGGRTGALLVHVGDLARANASPLVTINQIRPILVAFPVPQADVAALQARSPQGLGVEVMPAGQDGVRLPGRLVFVDNRVDSGSGTLLLKAELPNREAVLWPGQFVRVRLRLAEQTDAVVVPVAAISESQEGSFLYVVGRDTTVESRPVRVARTWNGLAVVAEGLRPGEVVVTDGQLRLSPGAKASIRPAEGPARAGGTGAVPAAGRRDGRAAATAPGSAAR